jgi:hypothetical protein
MFLPIVIVRLVKEFKRPDPVKAEIMRVLLKGRKFGPGHGIGYCLSGGIKGQKGTAHGQTVISLDLRVFPNGRNGKSVHADRVEGKNF